MKYVANKDRYQKMQYERCGASGLKLPKLSLGLWHNFGTNANVDNCKKMLFTAFDNGITHFDLANNYGPLPGSAESNFGKVINKELKPYRDELIISTKAGYYMWEGPYGEWGSKKYLVASLDQSLKRMGIDYVDIFYHHRPDPDTPIEETAEALDLIVRQGKALYVGISNYDGEQTAKITKLFREKHTPFIINQVRYNMFDRHIEDDLVPVLKEENIGCIVFSPLAQGLLTDRYLKGIPQGSRVTHSGFLRKETVDCYREKIIKLNDLASKRVQTLSQMALAWVLRIPEMTSVLIGASSPEQVLQNAKMLDNLDFTKEELDLIDDIVKE